jgi:aminocarboxymuconate-semialdehyde decarboxylase
MSSIFSSKVSNMTNSMIDIHTHILPPEIPAFKKIFAQGGFLTWDKYGGSCNDTNCQSVKLMKDSGEFFREVQGNCFSPKLRLQDMRQHAEALALGTSYRQVLSTVPAMFSYHAKGADGLTVAMYLNDHIAQLVSDHPQEFIGLGTLPMQDPELAVREIERTSRSLPLRGFQIGSCVETWNLSDPRFLPIYEALEKASLCLFVHPWDMIAATPNRQRYWLPWLVGMPAETTHAICTFIFGGVFEKFPRLRVAFAHGGGQFPFTIGRIAHGHAVRPDLCAQDNPHSPRKYLGHFYVDSLVHDVHALQYMAKVMGEDKICMGSDYPFPLGEALPGKLIGESGFSPEIQKKMLQGNALDWLNGK